MEFPGKPAQRRLKALAIACIAASISGCASPGPARPPSLHLSRLVADLTAARSGNDVTLHWTTPDTTTDGLKIQPPIMAEICRELPTQPTTCAPVKRVAVQPGPSETTDTLPSALTTDPESMITYRVQILNSHGRSAGLSNPAFAAAGSAPPSVEHLKITPVRNGAMIEWLPQPAPSFVDLDRTLVQTTVPKRPSPQQPRQLTPSTPIEVHLQSGKQSADRGGTIDPTAQRGETYRYTVQRVRSVTLNGHTLELRSLTSAALTVVMRDTFPPATPTGLAAAPGTGSIDLSWEPNTEPDLAGYIIYRQPVASGAFVEIPTRLTSAPISAPAFSDRTAVPGQIYSYRVAAIDTSGNESPASAEAQESLRKQ